MSEKDPHRHKKMVVLVIILLSIALMLFN